MPIEMNKFDRSISLISWAYNEEENILKFLQRATNLLEEVTLDYEILLIDDGSTDNTFALAERFRLEKNPRLRIHRNLKNMNVGYCHRKAISLAQKEYLLWQMVDWSYNITHLREHLEHLREYDIVQGVRRGSEADFPAWIRPFIGLVKIFGITHVSNRSDSVPKALVSLANYLVIRTLFRIPLSDYQNVTIYQTQWIQALKYESDSSFINPEGLIKAHWAGLSIKEVPIGFLAREKGDAKGVTITTMKRAVRDISKLWIRWYVLSRRPRNLHGKIQRLSSIEFSPKFGANLQESG